MSKVPLLLVGTVDILYAEKRQERSWSPIACFESDSRDLAVTFDSTGNQRRWHEDVTAEPAGRAGHSGNVKKMGKGNIPNRSNAQTPIVPVLFHLIPLAPGFWSSYLVKTKPRKQLANRKANRHGECSSCLVPFPLSSCVRPYLLRRVIITVPCFRCFIFFS